MSLSSWEICLPSWLWVLGSLRFGILWDALHLEHVPCARTQDFLCVDNLGQLSQIIYSRLRGFIVKLWHFAIALLCQGSLSMCCFKLCTISFSLLSHSRLNAVEVLCESKFLTFSEMFPCILSWWKIQECMLLNAWEMCLSLLFWVLVISKAGIFRAALNKGTCVFRYLWGLLRKLNMKMYTVSAICVSRYCECYRIPAVCLFNTVLDYFFYCHAKFQDWILSPHSYGMYLQLYTHSLT